jgi:hypothetical protein
MGPLDSRGADFACVTDVPQSLSLNTRTPGRNQWRWRRWRFLPEQFNARCLQSYAGGWLAGGEQGLAVLDEELRPAGFFAPGGAASSPIPGFSFFCASPQARKLIVYDEPGRSFREYSL